MATATLTHNGAQNDVTANDMAIKPENVEYRVYFEVDASGNAVIDTKTKEPKRELVSGEKQFELKDKPDSGYTLALTQSVRTYRIGSLDGLSQLVTDPEEAVAIANRGLAQKFQQKIKKLLLEVNESGQLEFEPIEGVLDSQDMLNETTQRRNLSQTDKAVRGLKTAGYTPDEIDIMLKAIIAARG